MLRIAQSIIPRLVLAPALILAAAATPALAGHHAKASQEKMTGTIVETAQAAGQFETLLAAAGAAGLADALSGPGPLTVFAPTDEAFAKLPEGTVASLLEPENIDQLAAILKYHVVSGRLAAKDVLARSSVATLEGGSPTIDTRDGEVFIDDARIVAVDVAASNGIIHVIDEVLMPPSLTAASAARDLIDYAIARGAPLYNDGQKRACASVYEVAAHGLLAMDTLDRSSRRTLERTLAANRHNHDWDDRAWDLRRALDRVRADVGGDARRMMPVAMR